MTTPEDHYNSAAKRHLVDALYLHDDSRLPNADHHYRFAVECALESMVLRYGGASMAPKNPQKPKYPNKPWIGATKQDLGHLPTLWTDLPLHLTGRGGGKLLSLLTSSEPFDTWRVDDRYLDGSAVSDQAVLDRKQVSIAVLALEQEAILVGSLP